jgi:hypothetical protein
MATEDILIRYRADVSQLESDINKVIDSQEELTKATQQNTAEQKKAVTAQEFAAKKRVQLLEQEKQKLEQIKNTQKTAFDPTTVEKYNQQVAASQKRIDSLGTSYKNAADQAQASNQQLLGGINKIAGAFGIAFSAEALIQFGQQAVGAFLEAEEVANKLRFAVINIAGESEEALARLEAQAQQVADTTFFGDDDVKAAQAAGLAFGLTADQVERAIPALVEFATVNQTDVQGAMQALGGALQGRAGDFRNFNVEVKATNTQAENLDAVIAGVAKQTGAAGAALKTAAGQAKDFKDELGEFTETVGQGIVLYFQELFQVLSDIINPLVENFKKIGRALIDLIPDSIIKKLGELTNGFNLVQTAFRIGFAPLKAAVTVLNLFYETLIKGIPYIVGFVNVVKDGFGEIRDLASSLGDGISNLFQGITEFDTGKLKAGVTKLKTGFQNIGFDVAKSFNQGFQRGQAAFNLTDDVEAAQTELTDNLLKSDELRKKSLTELRALQLQYAKDQTNEGRQNLEAIEKEIKAQEEAAKAAEKAAEEAKKQAEEVKKLINSIDEEITKLSADLAKRKIEIIPAMTFDEQRERIQLLADLNEESITDEIAAKIKLVQEDAKLTDKQKADIIAKYEELKKRRLEFAKFNEANDLNIISKKQAEVIAQSFANIEKLDFEEALKINANEIETANEAVAKSFEDLGKAVGKSEFEAAKAAAENATKELQKQIKARFFLRETDIDNAKEAEIQKAIDAGTYAEQADEIDKKYKNLQKENANKTYKDLKQARKEYDDFIDTQLKSETSRWIQKNQEILQQTASIVAEINAIFQQSTENRISQIEEEKDAQLASIEEQLLANQEYFEKRRISEEEFAENEKALQDERVRIEKETQKKIKEEKRKQALLDKAAAVFQIAINTAVAATNPAVAINPILQALVILQGAIQTAAVLAQPIPYRKGSKDTGPKGHLARVGEEGEELVFMPSNSKVLPARQTRKYADIIDAMYDNKLDDYVYKNYITPALMAQKEAKDNQRAKSFAENMANSIVYNQTGLTPSDLEAQRKRGQYIRNVDEIADAIAKKLPIRDIYRA